MTIDLKALIGAQNLDKESVVLLPDLAVIEVTGKDAESFLHGQFTQRLTAIGDQFLLAAYCQPKGRMLASMRVWRTGDAFYLLIARDLLESFVKRLSIFVLRSDVKIRVAKELAVAGVINLPESLPEVEHTVCREDGTVLARLPDFDGVTRAYAIGNLETLKVQATTSDGTLWQVLDIVTGLGHVEDATREAFVPQWLNFDKARGMVFDKGCYPGQEVIARIQHIGKTSRRMFIAVADADLDMAPNETVTAGEEPGQVVAGCVFSGRTFALLVLPAQTAVNAQLTIKDVPFTILEPPYGL